MGQAQGRTVCVVEEMGEAEEVGLDLDPSLDWLWKCCCRGATALTFVFASAVVVVVRVATGRSQHVYNKPTQKTVASNGWCVDEGTQRPSSRLLLAGEGREQARRRGFCSASVAHSPHPTPHPQQGYQAPTPCLASLQPAPLDR